MTEKNMFINFYLFYFCGKYDMQETVIEMNLNYCHLLCLGLFYTGYNIENRTKF